MSKYLKLLLASLLLTSSAVAQSSPIPPFRRNDSGATVVQQTNGQPSQASVTQYGEQFITTKGTPIPFAGTLPISNAVGLNGIGAPLYAYGSITNVTCTGGSTTTCNVVSAVPRVGDLVQGSSGTAGNIGVQSVVTTASGTVVTFSPAFPSAVANADVLRILRPSPVQGNYVSDTGTTTLFINGVAGRDNWVRLQGQSPSAGEMLQKPGVVTTTNLAALTDGQINTFRATLLGALWSSLSANATGGYTNYSQGALVGTVTAVKSSAAGTLGGFQFTNPAGTTCYVQIFDVATAGAVTLGTTVPTISIAMLTGSVVNLPPAAPGAAFANGIQIASTTTRTGNTPCGTGTDVNIWYK